MPYTARFSKAFLKKEKQLPSAVKSRIVETLKETLMKPGNGIMLVGRLRVYGKCELENIELSMKLMSKRKGLFSMTLNSGKKCMNKIHTTNKKNNLRTYPLPHVTAKRC